VPPSPARRRLAAGCLAGGCALAVVAGACGGSARGTTHPAAKALPPSVLLRRSRAVLDATRAVHFTLAGHDIVGSSVELTAGSGDLVRPDELTGSFTVSSGGLSGSVGVVEVGGRFYAEPPFASHYSVTNPAGYGLGDPAALLDPTTGVSALLTSMTGVHAEGRRRISGELVAVIGGTIPGRLVPVLPDLARAVPVTLTASIDPTTAQLRQVSLAGPFTSAKATTTYTVTLTDYGEHVTVTAPAT
jgi:hypothetical protein